PSIYHYPLAASSYSSGQLDLNFDLDDGFRASVAQLWLVERVNVDTTAPASSVIAPTNNARLSGDEITIQGDANDGAGSGVAMVEVGIDSGTGIVWSPVSDLYADSSWLYRWRSPVDGAYTIQTRARDRAGNIETPAVAINVQVDQTAPMAIENLSVGDTPGDNGGSLDVSWSLSGDDGAGGNDVTDYVIERRILNGEFSDTGVVSAGVAQYIDAGVVTGSEYEYRITTVDEAGNRTESAVYGPATAIDNSLADSTAPEDISGLSGTPGNQFVYLQWMGSIDSSNDLVDQRLEISVDAGVNWGTNAPTYDDGNSISLGKSPTSYLVSNLTNNTGYQFRIRTQDGALPAPNLSAGVQTGTITPSETAYTAVSGTISADTTWSAGVYYVSANVTLASGVTLRIKPGVVVKFKSSTQMTVNGTLLAEGAAGNPVVFTAFSDDSYGGDTNGDGPSTGTPGYWQHLDFTGAGSDDSILSHSVVRYSGSSTGSIYMSSSDATIVNSTIELGASDGIYTTSSIPMIEGNQVVDHASNGIYVRNSYAVAVPIHNNTISRNGAHGVYAYNSALSIEGNTITDNTSYGIFTGGNDYGSPEIKSNTITGNAKPARLRASALPGPDAGNTLLPNTTNQLEIIGTTLGHDVTLTPDLVYYQVSGTVTVAAGSTLRLMPGVVWKIFGGSSANLTINGALTAVGTSDEKIVFTSYRDDSVGGDTNGDGYSEAAPGDWGQISFSNTVIDFITRLEHVVVRFGGGSNSYNVSLSNTNMTIADTEISSSGYRGLYINGGSPTIENSRIIGSKYAGVYDVSSTALLRGNEISRNGTY
ncbi:MAG: hypothetical protein GY821_00165, partial [Gammaproteobacteria bacterium]|nr:hypothetical protein [Gammaproteobacteria bacterium]